MAQPGRSPEVDAELKKLQGVQSELQALAASRSQFYQQANENGVVKQELDLLEDEAPVFKLVGPVLIKQDLEEAKQNVAKRLELIEREMYATFTVFAGLWYSLSIIVVLMSRQLPAVAIVMVA